MKYLTTCLCLLFVLIYCVACDGKKRGNHASPLQQAIMVGNNTELKKALSKGPRQFSTYSKKISPPIFLAVDKNNIEAISLLIRYGDDINRRDPQYGYCPIHRAALQGKVGVISFLLKNGADVNATAGDGRTPLMYACSGKKHKAYELLAQNGANINAVENNGRTALFYAVYNEDQACIQFLLSRSAQLDIVTSQGDTVLTEAIEFGNIEIAEMIINNGASPNAGSPPPLSRAVVRKNIEAVRLLITNEKLDINATDRAGVTPLRDAKVRGYTEIAKLLEEKGALEFVE